MVSMTMLTLAKAETAPFAGGGSVLVSAVKLNVLNGMAQAKLVNASASGSVAVYLDDRKRVD